MIHEFTPTIIIHLVCLFLSLMALIFTWRQKPSDNQQALFKLSIFVFIVVFGYFLSYVAYSPETAVLATRIIYSGCVFYYFSLYFYAGVFNYKIPKAVKIAMLIVTVFNVAASVSFDAGSFFFSSWKISMHPGGYYQFSAASGVGEQIYTWTNMAMALYSVWIVHSISRHYSRTRKNQAWAVGIVVISVPVVYTLEALFNMSYLVPVVYALGQVVLSYLVWKTGLYDVDDIIHEEAFKGMNDAIIVYDDKLNFRGANPLAIKLYRKLGKISHREPITERYFPELIKIIRGEVSETIIENKIYEARILPIEGSKGLNALWMRDVTQRRKSEELMRNYQKELEKEVAEKTAQISEMQDNIIRSMADIIENRDDNTGGHVKRTSYVVSILIQAMKDDNYPGVNEIFGRIVTGTAPLHDIGKISIPDSVLLKPGKLTDEEFGIMKSHSAKGAGMVSQVLKGVEYPSVISISENIARSHHEKWDGSGYPDHLKDEEIPLEARIMAIADVYDALVSRRVYKEPMPFDKAYDIINSGFGTQFDPSLKKYFDQCRKEIEDYYEKENNAQ